MSATLLLYKIRFTFVQGQDFIRTNWKSFRIGPSGTYNNELGTKYEIYPENALENTFCKMPAIMFMEGEVGLSVV